MIINCEIYDKLCNLRYEKTQYLSILNYRGAV